MRLAVGQVLMDFRVQSRFHLLRGPTERDHVPAGRHAFDLKSLALEPLRYFIDIALVQSKAAAELFRREPAPILWRTAFLLGSEQGVEIRLLCRRHLKSHGYVHAHGRIHSPLVQSTMYHRMHVSRNYCSA